jgi:hypothetical protein
MENSGEAVDDQGSGWFQVKKVLFLSFVKYSHCLVDKEAKKEKRKKKKEKRILCFVDASFLLSFSWLDISAYISIHAIDHVFSFAK